ncbi:hypothetical protein [Pseudobutyrivibrio ruminis]|uniref:Uncharacterized protein n=1 Tax=Pseudobutyrivibrio ruminis TaxID=46206 RepID=A0A2G3DT64_9FIRM|nr:hypothetical protein [Pseudobutyrivibrio ruminis]PHU34227.1 hypothetical protein CSX01_11720 [Pseudobutyrivibrio ruminis]
MDEIIWYRRIASTDNSYWNDVKNYCFWGDNFDIVKKYHSIINPGPMYKAIIIPDKLLIIEANYEKHTCMKIRRIDMMPDTHYEDFRRYAMAGNTEEWFTKTDTVAGIISDHFRTEYDALIIRNIYENKECDMDNHIMNDIVVFDKKIIKSCEKIIAK